MKEALIVKIKKIFETTSDRYEVHEKCKPLLEEISGSKEFLYDVIKSNISNPEFLNRTRHYSTLTMTVAETNSFSLIVNIFPPLPDRRTDISFQSVHHHGSLILSTVATWGPGYDSILFKKGFSIDHSNGIAQMEIDKDYHNQLNKVEFIDAFTPHIVFYPTDFTATYAFWCDYRKTAKENIKKLTFLNSLRKPVAKFINLIGLGKILGLNKVEHFDFYIDKNQLITMKTREAYDVAGDNDNFLQNIFCFIQQTGFHDEPFLRSLLDRDDISPGAKKNISLLINKTPINDHFFEGHLNIPKVNISREELKTVFGNQLSH